MKQWPDYNANDDLPSGIHEASLAEVLRHFGTRTLRRRIVARRLERIYKLAHSTGQVARFVIFGSFVTAKPDPEDVDIFMLMENTFDVSQVAGEAKISSTTWRQRILRGLACSGLRAQPHLAGTGCRRTLADQTR